jgi:hypothetical protein
LNLTFPTAKRPCRASRSTPRRPKGKTAAFLISRDRCVTDVVAASLPHDYPGLTYDQAQINLEKGEITLSLTMEKDQKPKIRQVDHKQEQQSDD